jgi:hypothetical protein
MWLEKTYVHLSKASMMEVYRYFGRLTTVASVSVDESSKYSRNTILIEVQRDVQMISDELFSGRPVRVTD